MMQETHITTQGEFWRETMRRPIGVYNERTESDAVERDIWKRMMAERGGYKPDPHSEAIASAVFMIMADAGAMDTILELGPGWGNYTLKLARRCRALTCVDISEDNLTYLKKIAADNGVNNINTIAAKWEDCIPPRCDMTFAYNCFYRMIDIEDCLRKINDSTEKLCVIGMGGCPEQPYLSALDEAGMQARYTRMNHINLRAILRDLGARPYMMEIPNEREFVYDNFDALFERARGYLIEPVSEDALKEILLRYYHPEADGRWRCRYHYTSGLLWWRPV